MSSAKRILKASFIKRPNRFLAKFKVDNSIVDVFVSNPGRMKELMIPGKQFFIRENSGPQRKTDYDLIGVKHDGVFISLDSNLPNRFLRRLLQNHQLPYFGNYSKVIPEPRYYDGRFDFKLESTNETTLIEVKSCTLVNDGQALFPDAPTTRGARHMKHLAQSLIDRIATKAAVVFVIQRPDATVFSPNDSMDPHFGDALRVAHDIGVRIIPLVTKVIDWELVFQKRIPYKL